MTQETTFGLDTSVRVPNPQPHTVERALYGNHVLETHYPFEQFTQRATMNPRYVHSHLERHQRIAMQLAVTSSIKMSRRERGLTRSCKR